jgi:hypothetical protein
VCANRTSSAFRARWTSRGQADVKRHRGRYEACFLGGMRRIAFVSGSALAFAAALLACGACGSGRLPAPAYTQHPTRALSQVPYPPPPARVEYVPERPEGPVVWVDGEWTWQGRRWAWKPGRWVVPPERAAFAPWTAVRNPAGTLFAAEGAWRDARGLELPEPEPVAVGTPTHGTPVTAEGEEVPTGPTVPAKQPSPEASLRTTAIVDAGLLPPEGGTQRPEGGTHPTDASLLRDVELMDVVAAPPPADTEGVAGDDDDDGERK